MGSAPWKDKKTSPILNISRVKFKEISFFSKLWFQFHSADLGNLMHSAPLRSKPTTSLTPDLFEIRRALQEKLAANKPTHTEKRKERLSSSLMDLVWIQQKTEAAFHRNIAVYPLWFLCFMDFVCADVHCVLNSDWLWNTENQHLPCPVCGTECVQFAEFT